MNKVQINLLISSSSSHLLCNPLMFFLPPNAICNSLPLSLSLWFHYLILSEIDQLCLRGLCTSVWSVLGLISLANAHHGAVARGGRQSHKFAPRTTCQSVTTNDGANLLWSLNSWTLKQRNHRFGLSTDEEESSPTSLNAAWAPHLPPHH